MVNSSFDLKDALIAACKASLKSPCRSKRGVSIWNRRGLISTGFNDQPRGFRCDGSPRCKESCSKTAVHAEQSAILSGGQSVQGASLLHVKTVDGAPVVSGPPSCLECSKLILEAGVSAVWLLHATGWTMYWAAEFHRITAIYHHLSLIEVDHRAPLSPDEIIKKSEAFDCPS
jgi:deoxycytidylate deaminase